MSGACDIPRTSKDSEWRILGTAGKGRGITSLICPWRGKISLNIYRSQVIYNRVRRFQNIIFALAAFLWLSASAHCQLETVPGLEFLRCSVTAGNAHQPAKDCSNCCSVEQSQYRADHVRLNVPTPELLPVFSAPVLLVRTALPAEVSLGILTAAPPWLPSRHFASRTALPARAPSITS